MENPPRISLITTPHKGIRNFMSQLSLKAGSVDYANREEVKELKRHFEDIGILLEEHAASETNFILPALEARVPGSAAQDEAGHEALHHLQDKLLDQLNHILEADIPSQEARQLGYLFYQDFSRLHAGHLEHMLEEETGTQVLMWQHFTDEEMLQIHAQIIRSIPPHVMLIWMKYILPAQTSAERLQLLRAQQTNAPAAFFKQVMEVAREAIPISAYQQIEDALKPTVAG